MTLAQKLLQKLEGVTSRTAIPFAALAAGHKPEEVERCLKILFEQKEVLCCKITKGGATNVVWWKTGVIEDGNKFMRLTTYE